MLATFITCKRLKKPDSEIYGLYQQLFAIELGESSIIDYIERIKSIVDDIRASGESLTDRAIIAAALKGLPDRTFRQFKDSWYHEANKNLRTFFYRLLTDQSEEGKQRENSQAARSNESTAERSGADVTEPSDSKLWMEDVDVDFHVAKERHLFWTLDESRAGELVSLRDRQLRSRGVGQVRIECHVRDKRFEYTLSEVRWVPESDENVFSLKAALSLGWERVMSFRRIKLRKDHETVMIGKWTDYSFRMNFRVQKRKKADLKWLHECMGHAHVAALVQLMQNQLVVGLDHVGGMSFFSCQACEAKPRKLEPCGPNVGEVVHCALSVLRANSIDGSRYFAVLMDDKSDYRHVLTMHGRNYHSIADSLLYYCTRVEHAFHRNVKAIMMDNRHELKNVKKLIAAELSAIEFVPCKKQKYARLENKAKREINALIESAAAMLRGRQLPKSLWPQAVQMAAWIRNRTCASYEDKTPYELWHGKKPDIADIPMFGSTCRYESELLKDSKETFVGFNDYEHLQSDKLYMLYNRATRELTVTSLTMIFDEDE